MVISSRQQRVLRRLERDLARDPVLTSVANLFPAPAPTTAAHPPERRPIWARPALMLVVAGIATAAGIVGMALVVPLVVAVSFGVIVVAGVLIIMGKPNHQPTGGPLDSLPMPSRIGPPLI